MSLYVLPTYYTATERGWIELWEFGPIDVEALQQRHREFVWIGNYRVHALFFGQLQLRWDCVGGWDRAYTNDKRAFTV